VRPGSRRVRLQHAVIVSAAAALLGCERKAPSQQECFDYAMLTLRINDPRLLAVPAVADKLDEVVVKCLTTPFDKQLIQCVKTRSSARSCLYEFEDRDRRRGLQN
jgi:hypothetical protein